MVVERGVSAAKPLEKREGGSLLLGRIAQRDVGGVVAVKLDRLFRNTIDCLENVMSWSVEGVALHLIDFGGQSIDTGTAMGKMFLTVAAGFAELERNLISERTRNTLERLRQQNRKTGGDSPFGFMVGSDKQTLVPRPREQFVITQIRKMRDDGLSIRKIAETLNQKGVAARGKKWHPTTVARLLNR